MHRNAMVAGRAALDDRLHALHFRILILLGLFAPLGPWMSPSDISAKIDAEEPWLTISLRELTAWGYVAHDEGLYRHGPTDPLAAAKSDLRTLAKSTPSAALA